MPEKRIVVITGAAPYLGGPSTWLPLRRTAPELRFVEIDVLDFIGAQDIGGACCQAIYDAARDADGVVAHNTAAKPAIEALAQMSHDVPLLLLSPMFVQRDTPATKALRTVAKVRAVQNTLTALARAKAKRLLTDRRLLRSQMALLVGEDYISAELLEEALSRVGDQRTVRSVERTAEVLLSVMSPIDPAADAKVQNRSVLLGTSRLDCKMATRLRATILPHVKSAPMIENPKVVAQVLMHLL